MTEVEFQGFAKRLFIQYPSLYEWLQRSSPDPVETQKLWRKTLSAYTLTDAMWVLDMWQDNQQTPFEAYERDKVASIVRSVIQRKLDKEARKREREEELRLVNERHRKNRKGEVEFVPAFGGDLGCLSAFNELKPIYAAWKEGKIDRTEYDERETEILERHIDGKPKREIEGKYAV